MLPLFRTCARRSLGFQFTQLSSFAGGFSYPAPRKLDEIVKLSLLSQEPKEEVQNIWESYHLQKECNIADIWDVDEFNNLQAVAKSAGNIFIFPVPREEGYFNVISQVQGSHVLFTYLEDYKTDPSGAQPYLVLTFYNELAKNQNIVLVRGDIMPNTVTAEESKRLLKLVKHYYLEESDVIANFTKGIFDFEKHTEKALALK